MDELRIGIIGCGRPLRADGATGYGMSHWHARGYASAPHCRLTALADISLENARAFQEEHGGERIYEDYREMLSQESLDIVSVCTWPHLHTEMVCAAAEAGVRAVHCEKPMAPTWNEARAMVETCEQFGAQLTFNHQRRFGSPFQQARQLLRDGAVGNLIRLEASCSNLFDWGTHWFDMLCYYNDEQSVEWVLGQVDWRGGPTHFGVPMEGQGLSHFKYSNGVHGLLVTGYEAGWEAQNRLVGDEGVIEVATRDRTALRVWSKGHADWQIVEARDEGNDLDLVSAGICDLVDALRTGREPELSGQRALRATELIFATYESSRRRGRVELPLVETTA